ncbi:Ff.00g028530.m01.CDS01 [Fusarium sp. VM40]|nr:Ff.00g028530.m01.CDS01 [Fusarium sp. VM40]
MCYFDQTYWTCGYWRWGYFRQHCNKEYRIGETCGLKLVYETKTEDDVCKLCHDTEKKQRRYDNMYRDIQRWQREGNRNATIERTCSEMHDAIDQIYHMREEHNHRLQSLGTTQVYKPATSLQASPIPSSMSPSGPSLTASLPTSTGAHANMIELSSARMPDAEVPTTSGEIPNNVADKEDAIICGLPNSLAGALAHDDVDVFAHFLKYRLEVASSGDYGWIAELNDIGYDSTEIAQLLYEKANDSPWIYFEPETFGCLEIRLDNHIRGCVHQLLLPSPISSFGGMLGPSPALKSDRDVIRRIEETCGLGGISPFSRDKTRWNGIADFQEKSSVVSIRHRAPPSSATSIQDTTSRLIQVAENFSTAVRTVQNAGFCCDSFTVLRISTTPSEATCPELQLSRVDFALAGRVTVLLRTLERVWMDGPQRELVMEELRTVSQAVLTHAIGQRNLDGPGATEEVLNLTSLALQFLCLGFLSYAQAHIGMLHPFFLDPPLRRIILLGTQAAATPELFLEAELVELTCLSGMCQGPVLAFGGPSLEGGFETKEPCKYDVRALPEDILDTWGPGELVYGSMDRATPLAIKIGRGYICPPSQHDTAGKHHWDSSANLLAPSPPLKLHEEMVIGSLVTDNPLCSNNEKKCWQDSSRGFNELGTYNSYSEVSELQGGFQVGWDHLAITSNVIWAKRRGRTIKDKTFETEAYMSLSFLEFYWGVRVSFCTGVAQRVLLRELVADLLPAFAECYPNQATRTLWAKLLGPEHQIIQRLKGILSCQTPLSVWLENLPEDLRKLVHILIRHILETLKDTGLSPDGKHFSVAWPQTGFVNRCFRICVDEHNRWMPMLADSADCATFAYISNTCLEVASFKCRGPDPSWQGRVHLLETAVHCPASTGSWTLQPERAYFFQKVNNTLFWVKAQRDTPSGASPVALIRDMSVRSLPRDIVARLLFTNDKRMQRWLREKDLTWVTAENVSVS